MDLVIHIESVFSLGYVKPFPRFRSAPPPTWRSAPRARAARSASPTPTPASASPTSMNRTGFRLYDDPRELALRDALYRCLGERPQA